MSDYWDGLRPEQHERMKYLEARVAELEAALEEMEAERDELLKKTVDETWPVPEKLPEDYWESAQ